MSLIVIEGLDGSGKGTQAKLLVESIAANAPTAPHRPSHPPVRHISFPDYKSDSSMLVRMYLRGDFGSNPSEVNAYAASAFYSVDRFASYHTDWKDDYLKGVPIIADRYTTSNISFQTSKLPKDRWDSYILWLEDLEYGYFELPRPDKVVYLDVEPVVSQALMNKRYENDPSKKDIHEADLAFLSHCRDGALYAAQKLGWTVIRCDKDGAMRSEQDIHDEIVRALSGLI